MERATLWATLLLASLTSVGAVSSESEILERILDPARFDNKVRPPGLNGSDTPVDVRVVVEIRKLLAVREADTDMTLQLVVRQMWTDTRLRFDDMDIGPRTHVTLTDVSRAWQPDVFFSDEKEGHVHDILTPNVYMRIFANGLVHFSVRTSMKFYCEMDFRRYPLDTQICNIRMLSYAYTERDIRLLWRGHDPVLFVKEYSSAGLFRISHVLPGNCSFSSATGPVGCLKAGLVLPRDARPALLRAYLPSALLVAASWAAFWTERRWRRVALLALAAAAVAYVTAGPLATLPPLPYSPALQLWRDACLGFLACGLLQVLVVSYVVYKQRVWHSRRQNQDALFAAAASQQQQQQQQQQPAAAHDCDDNATFGMKLLSPAEAEATAARVEGAINPWEGGGLRAWLLSPTLEFRLDSVSKIGFPAAFALFNLAYWASVLN